MNDRPTSRLDVLRNRLLSRAWLVPLGVSLGFALLFLALSGAGAHAAWRGRRVLSFLDLPFAPLVGDQLLSVRWLLDHAVTLGGVVTASALLLGAAAVWRGGRRGAPLVLLLVCMALAVWGQVALFAERPMVGAWLYIAAALGMLALGIWRPLTRVEGFRPLDTLTRTDGGPLPPMPARLWEWWAMGGLMVVALLLRLYALTELPSGHDDELVLSRLASASLHGWRQFLLYLLPGNNMGVFHVPTQYVLGGMFGFSLYAINLSAVLWGLACIPLFYLLARRLVGPVVALLATALFMVSPEQLFWSRSANVEFIMVIFLALVTLNLGLWMAQRWRWTAVLAGALWMPMCRFFFTPSFVLLVFFPLTCLHSLVFMRRAWRRAWYVVPLLAVGLMLFVYSISFVHSYLYGSWRFVHPLMVHGGAAWNRYAPEPDAGPLRLALSQLNVVIDNVPNAAAALSYHQPYADHWLQRRGVDERHPGAFHAVTTILLVLGLGYLLGQPHDRRAWLLLSMFGLGLVPGMMTDEPAMRRMIVAVAPLHGIATVALALLLFQLRSAFGGRRWMDRLPWSASLVLLTLAGAVTLWTSMVSVFSLPIRQDLRHEQAIFARPVFEQSDVLIHNIFDRIGHTIMMGNMQRILSPERSPCVRYAGSGEWPGVILRPACDYSMWYYEHLLTPQERERRAREQAVERVGFLLEVRPDSAPHVDLLRALFPSAQVAEATRDQHLVWFLVDEADLRDIRTPVVLANEPVAASGVLTGTTVSWEPDADMAHGAARMEASLLLEQDAWLAWRVEPAQAGAVVRINGQPRGADVAEPLVAGMHELVVDLPAQALSTLPLELHVRHEEQTRWERVPAAWLFHPRVIRDTTLRPASMRAYPGFRVAERVPLEGLRQPQDVTQDAEGNVLVLDHDGQRWRLLTIPADGGTPMIRELPLEQDWTNINAICRDGQGRLFVLLRNRMHVFDDQLEPLAEWDLHHRGHVRDLVPWGEDQLLYVDPNRPVLTVVHWQGQLLGELDSAGGQRLGDPFHLATDHGGRLLVIEGSGRALLFQRQPNHWAPAFVRAFPIQSADVPHSWPGCGFGGPDDIFIPNGPQHAPLAYSVRGERLKAHTARHDPGAWGLRSSYFFPAPGGMLALDTMQRVLLRLERVEGSDQPPATTQEPSEP